MKHFITHIVSVLLLVLVARSEQVSAPVVTEEEVITRMIRNENQLARSLAQFNPIVETYIQMLRYDRELGVEPTDDRYFLGRLELRRTVRTDSFLPKSSLTSRAGSGVKDLFSPDFSADGFSSVILLDPTRFNKETYKFRFVQREFLGEVRCLVFDVQPRSKSRAGNFQGRVWVEDEGYNIVRMNGRYQNAPVFKQYAHFDSWRVQVKTGEWLPAYAYSEEDDQRFALWSKKMHFKAQTRLWGYDRKHGKDKQEFTDVVVESAAPVRDATEQRARMASPVSGLRNWQRQAEDNVLTRLEESGLLAPPNEVDKVLSTVINNLLVSNDLNVESEIRCRLLLTTPLESFNIGNTIVLSRGLIDVLPDEASLAMVLAYELSHVLLGHSIDTKYSFTDRLQFEDLEILKRVSVRRSPEEVEAADKRALALLENSVYKDKLKSAALFLSILGNRSAQLPNLIRPTLGDRLAKEGAVLRMESLVDRAPQLQMRQLDQVASLPLGARVYVDPWNAQAELLKAPSVRLFLPREKMPFEIAPISVYLTRQRNIGAEK